MTNEDAAPRFHFFHNWSKWSTPFEVPMVRVLGDIETPFIRRRQRKVCSKCKKIKERVLS